VTNRAQAERIYGMRELTRILTLTPRRTAQLRRLGLLHGDSGYTFRDLLALRAAGALLDAGASVRQIRQALDALRSRNPGLAQPLVEVRLVLEGGRLLAQSDRVKFDPAQWEDAVAAYQRVVAIDPTYAAAWNNLGLLLHRMGRYDEAHRAYVAALEQDARCCEAVYNLGSLAEDRADLDGAIDHYRHALEIAPDYADAHFNLAGALARAGRAGEAIAHWQRYLELDAGSPWARIAQAHLEVLDSPGDHAE
jgi:tetratricopeptide (TPR) repeat protein